MLVCCGNGKPWEEMSELERLGCEHDHCTGPREETEEDIEIQEDAIIEIMNIAIYGASRKAVEQGADIQEAIGGVCRLFKDAGFIK